MVPEKLITLHFSMCKFAFCRKYYIRVPYAEIGYKLRKKNAVLTFLKMKIKLQKL